MEVIMGHTTRASSILAVLVLGGTAAADQWYVDAVHGSDANSGQSPGAAWRTITHALAAAPDAQAGGNQIVHVAPGQYDAALGESFPFYLRNAFQIVGDGGRNVTTIEANGTGSVMLAVSDSHCPGCNWIGPGTIVRGFTLRDAGVGVALSSGSGPMALELDELRITGMTSAGLDLQVRFLGSLGVEATGVEISGCQVGVRLDGNDSNYPVALYLVDSELSGNFAEGIHGIGPMILSSTRVRILGNAAAGVLLDHGSPQGPQRSAQLTDCLVAGNGGNGVGVGPTSNWQFTGTTIGIQGSTIADNALRGLDLYYTPPFSAHHDTTLANTLLYGNQDDFYENPAYSSIRSVAFCDVGDGDFAGSNGNISADPMFRGAGDYRLRWGSPCIDVGRRGSGLPDLDGTPRPLDGNLDTVRQADIGAYEFMPLAVARNPHAGSPAVFEQWGPAGGQASLLVSRGLPSAPPIATPFGDFYLNPSAYRDLGSSPVGSGPPAFRSVSLLSNPALVGRTFTFQALATSTVSNPALAYTNSVSVTVLP
jgi:hypothetical protein